MMTLPNRIASVLIAVGLASVSTSAAAQDASYNILLTNDDGIESPGIQVLADKLRVVGEVHVIAPCGERSGSSMSVALRDSMRLREVQRDGVPLGRCVDTTPAGTVLLAISKLAPSGGFDLVISGINRGANIGTVAHMSGTVGAAMTGALYEIPALAVSLGGPRPDVSYASDFVAQFVSELRGRPATPGVVLSINIPGIPEAEIRGVTFARMGGSQLIIDFEEVAESDAGRQFQPRISLASSAPAGSDTEAFLNNHITITPLLFDWTAHDLMTSLQEWTLTHEINR